MRPPTEVPGILAPDSDIPVVKLTPPAAPPAEVQRSSLCEQVSGAGAARLILISAPAGFGKTTAMAQVGEHLHTLGAEAVWLTLSSAENDAVRFLKCLNAAVLASGAAAPAFGPSFDAMTWLSTRSSRFALFLDNFETLREPAALALVRSIVERLPRGGQVVIGSRHSQPDLGLARLRAHGQLLEIGTNALRFTRDETDQYFRLRQQSALSSDAVNQLFQKTEGWITALWLASFSIDHPKTGSDFIQRFSGSTRTVADFLTEDVLEHQSPAVREFLMRTSILRYLEASLCQALVPGADAEGTLRMLDEQNLFLVSLADKNDTYRYHSLFADFLRARLEREHPGEVQRLHLAAAAWYEAHKRPVPAIDHAIDGGDHPYALALLERHAQRFLQEGRMRLLARWFRAMPPDAMRDHPVLRALSVWASLFTHGPWQAASELEQSGCIASTDPEVLAHVNAQRPLLLAMQDRYDEANVVGKVNLAGLPSCNAFADSVLRNAMANVFTVMGESQDAQRLIDSARSVGGNGDGDNTFARMYAESLEGMLDLQGGRLRQATARFRMSVNATRTATYNYTSGNAWAGVLYASVLYEANDFEGADHLVSVYLPLACDVGLPDHMISGHMIRARIAFYRGEVVKAFETLTALEYIGHQRQLPRVVANAKLERSRLLLLQGNSQASKEELDRADDPAVWERARQQRLPANELDYLSLARIRWEIHFGDARATLPQLEQQIAEATEQSRQRRALGLRVLQSLALQHSGDPAAAAEAMAGVVRQACPDGFMRLIVDEGELVGRLVHRLDAVLQEMPARRSDPIMMEYRQRLLDAFGPIAAESSAPAEGERLMEPLTRKEIQVLQLAANGCSNSAMAEQLSLSDSTVRTHLRNINNKLYAHSRSEAVAIARRLGVIR
jgi:LuxR family maltose regulon positive regulatory protein